MVVITHAISRLPVYEFEQLKWLNLFFPTTFFIPSPFLDFQDVHESLKKICFVFSGPLRM